MKPIEFRNFLGRLGELSPEQMRALGEVMAGSRDDAIALIGDATA